VLAVACLGAMLAAPGNTQQGAFDPNAPDQFIALMKEYLSMGERWVQMAGKSDSAAYLAIEGIAEIYEQRGAKAQAIPHLRRLLDAEATTATVRTLLRFKLRDLYNETGQSEKALAELDHILAQAR